MWTSSKTRRCCGRSIDGRPQRSRLVELDAAVEQRSAVRVAVAKSQTEGANACRAMDGDRREGHGVAVVRAVAEQSDATGRVVEHDRLELCRLEVDVCASVVCVEIVFVEVLAMILVHRKARLAPARRVDVAVSIRLV